MARENEIKISLKINLNDFIGRIETKNFKLIKTLNQTDIYFDTQKWFLYSNIAALRLRQVDNNDDSLSFKKVFYLKNINDYYIEEVEVKFPLVDQETVKEIFERLKLPYPKKDFNNRQELTEYLKQFGYYDEQVMPKIRRVYKNREDEIVIDDIEHVGTIVEMECKTNDPFKVVKTLLKPNEWKRSLEGTSYIWLKNVKGLKTHLTNLKRFKSEPDWNVWNNERDWYDKLNSTNS